MTGHELRKAKHRDHQRKFRQTHPEQDRRAVQLANKKNLEIQRRALEPFGVKSAKALVNMWLTGKIQIIKDGNEVTP